MGNRSRVLGKILVLALALMAILVLSFVVVMGYQMARMEAESFDSTYNYDLGISTIGPIDNVVLLIPVPVYYNTTTGRNETPLDLTKAGFSRCDPDNVTISLEEIDGVPMMKISADRITPLYRSHIDPIPILPGQNESELPPVPTYVYSDHSSEETPDLLPMEMTMYISGVDHEIDTRSPLGTEPLFAPHTVLGAFNGNGDVTEEGYYLSGGSTGFFVEVPFILSYESDEDNVLSAYTRFEGRNEWWVLGWRGNNYREVLSFVHTGPANGTYPARGVIFTGEGVY